MKFSKTKFLFRFNCRVLIFTTIIFITGCNLFGSKHKKEADGRFLADGLDGHYIWQLKKHGSYLYAAVDSGLYRESLIHSNDWQFIGPGHKMALTFVVWSDQEILTDYTSLYYTTNGGGSWQKYQNGFGGDTPFYPFDLELDPNNTDVIYAEVNGGSVAKSTDHGQSWKLVWGVWDEAGSGFFVRVDPNNSQIVWAGGASTGPLLIKSTNGGQNWQHLNPAQPIPETAVFDFVIHPFHSDTVLAGLGIGIYKSTDGGQQWKYVFHKASIFTLGQDQFHPQTVYGAGFNQTHTLFYTVSHNFGDTWTMVSDTSGSTGIRINDLVATTVKGKEVLFLGTNKGVYKYIVPK